ncbi:MAG TPA: hypothetical protein PLF40_26070 [Kofleriaceae bacterium]|nr:hypothetical protein [Kofleriaceae bacterium]
MRTSLMLTTWLLAAAGCGPSARNNGGVDAADPTGDGALPTVDADTGPCRRMDFVFVVDDSGSMGEEQTSLGNAFPQFAQVLNDYRISTGQSLDYRVAVTTTGRTLKWTISVLGQTLPMNETGDNGAFRNTCGMTRRWLERTDPNMASTLTCRADVGVDGPTFEMPMLTTMMALKERIADGTNAGFLRDDALLAVVLITDEDDCSRRDNNFTVSNDHDGCAVVPSELATFLDTVKGGRGRWAAAVVAGPGPGECSSSFGKAGEAKRLKQFVTAANSGAQQNVVFSSICEGNMAASLTTALNKFQSACENFPPVE